MPNLVAYDLAGVQPMNGPTGLIFAMRSRYAAPGTPGMDGAEAFYNADTAFSGMDHGFDNTSYFSDVAAGFGTTSQSGTNPLHSTLYPLVLPLVTTLVRVWVLPTLRHWMARPPMPSTRWHSRSRRLPLLLEACSESRILPGTGTRPESNSWSECRAELANILSTEILAEINREVIRSIYKVAETGATVNTATAGEFNLDVDSNGRWSVEKFKGLLFQIERDANAIAQRTRRGKGNIIMTSADVASALTMAGVLDYTPALNANLNVDDTGNTFAGTINGKYRVYIDPYAANVAANQYYVVGYKGTSPYDAGLFYCPYVPLQMVRAVGENSFQLRLSSRPVTVWSLTHSLRALTRVLVTSILLLTATIAASRLPT